MASVNCFCAIIPAGNAAWVGLQWALEHEAHEVSSVIVTVVL